MAKPFGLPHFCSEALAASTSPFGLARKLYTSDFWYPGICGGSRLVAMSPPTVPP
jgi:hypothetical protein